MQQLADPCSFVREYYFYPQFPPYIPNLIPRGLIFENSRSYLIQDAQVHTKFQQNRSTVSRKNVTDIRVSIRMH